jgi:predicted DNA-binding protein (MmcQ/YjbR family)
MPMHFDRFRRDCAALPGATRDVKWGADEVWSVGGRMFAVFVPADGVATKLSFKCDAERFLELTDQPGVVPAPYLARAHWVQLGSDATLGAALIRELLERSHALVHAKLTRRQQAAIGAAAPARPKARP